LHSIASSEPRGLTLYLTNDSPEEDKRPLARAETFFQSMSCGGNERWNVWKCHKWHEEVERKES
jgi:hypothetical protein